MRRAFFGVAAMVLALGAHAQEFYTVQGVEPQPLLAQAMRLAEALNYLGNPLREEDRVRLDGARNARRDEEIVRAVQEILDPYCLAMVNINPEARVKVAGGPARTELIQNGWRSFLVKVHNEAALRSALAVTSPNAEPVLHHSSGRPEPLEANLITQGQLADRFLELKMYTRPPLSPTLSGLALEYVVVQMYTKETGRREAELRFSAGAGTEDIGFRNALHVLFDCAPSVKVVLRVKDHDGSPTTASFIIRDNVERLLPGDAEGPFPADYRERRAQQRPWESAASTAKRLAGIYPLPSRRVALTDEFPDFYFHPQVYRADGEHVYLPPGQYEVTWTRGPEYLEKTRVITVPHDVEVREETFELERWMNMAELGWYSGDHHVHAGGCSHYESPEAGVQPHTMFRQALGEDLNVSCVLSWGPCWYHQKSFFEGKVHELSTQRYIMRYDVEVSGFPSSHAGHLCLLRLTEDDYPGTTRIEEWPSWTLPVLRWGKEQGGVVGYSHSGWGLEPVTPTTELPNYVLPKMDGIGANEFIVTVVHDAVDFISSVDTPALWELNVWYHTLNCGFRARISGETDFPCIYDERVGIGRSYAPMPGGLNFDGFVEQIRRGANYVSDGYSHIIDFQADGAKMGVDGSELKLDHPKTVRVSAKVAAYLPETRDEVGEAIATRALSQAPYWHIERARIGATRNVPVELIVNSYPVARKEIVADGKWNSVDFQYEIAHSSWIALRVLPSSHTNPIFVLVDGKPIRASKRSAQWCLDAVEQCWAQKSPRIRESEQAEAKAAYDAARAAYRRILDEARDDGPAN